MISTVCLMSVPLDKEYKHTLWFESVAKQDAYFVTRVVEGMEYHDFTFQRKDNIIRLPVSYDELIANGVNYVRYTNDGYYQDAKWFYAFITDMQYINDGRTDVTIKTDVIQTWMFEKNMLPCFVEREHTADDRFPYNLVPEGLETGEFIVNRHTRSQYADDLCVLVGHTATPSGIASTPGFVTGLWSALEYYAYEPGNDAAEYGMAKLRELMEQYDEEGRADAVSIMFMAPKRMVKTVTNGPDVNYTREVDRKFINGETPDITVGISTLSLDGYSPRNNKLLTFPYRYLLTSNNNGGEVIYHYEQFYKKDDYGVKTAITNPEFLVEGVLCPGCSIRMIPMDYKGVHRNDSEGINMGKFPVLNWTSDAYTNWLTQNGVNIALNVAAGVGQIAAGVVAAVGTGGAAALVGAGLTSGGVSTIANTLAQIHQQSFTPPQAKGNINAGDVVTASGQNDFHFYDMSITKEYAEIIDGYFDMYGYKTNKVKIPEENHRENYWFTKTIDANITGEIPQDDLQEIKNCYNRGITFWKDPETFRDYTVFNRTA